MSERLSPQYIAGLFDGEGSISICKHKNSNGNPSYALVIIISNSYETN